MADVMTGASPQTTVAALEHLSGVARGTTTWITADDVDVVLTKDYRLRVTAVDTEHPGADAIARIKRRNGSFGLEAVTAGTVWVNGTVAETRDLRHADVIEFGEDGPLTRLRVFREGGRAQPGITDILVDAATYMRVSRRPLATRLGRMISVVVRRLMFETSIVFRGAVLAALAALAMVSYGQWQEQHRLRSEIALGAERLEGFAAALTRARSEALKATDLRELQREFQDRLTELEDRSDFAPRIIAEAAPSVAFLQGGYGFRHAPSGRMLRHAVDADGRKILMRNGQPALTLDGDGPVAERHLTGSGFWIADHNVLVTNRHVALPWEDDTAGSAMREQGFEPIMIRFVAYFPGHAQPLPLVLLRASDAVDLALLDVEGGFGGDAPSGLRLAERPQDPGSEIIVLGYPTGLRSLVVKAGPQFLEALQDDGTTDSWDIARQLARAGYVAPLATRGIVSQVTPASVLFDAETTHGGSGGPVLDRNGDVVAVGTAILPEFGGSNMGVPMAALRDLIAHAAGGAD